MSLIDDLINTIIDPNSKPNQFARWIIVLAVVCIIGLVIVKIIGGTY